MLTPEQDAWLKEHPEYQRVGPPRPDIAFRDVGTLYPDGSFTPLKPMQPIKLTVGPPYAVGVGIKS